MLKSVARFFRFLFRAIWFAAELLLFVATFTLLLLRHSGKIPQFARSRWLQWCSRRTLRVFSVEFESRGPMPPAGLLVCNHLSYLDILVLVALTPAVFVSKAEVQNWPVFGWFAKRSGTLFVDRTRRSDVTRMNAEIDRTLGGGGVLVLFPEGTSWNSHEILPFKSPLLEPVVGARHPLSVGRITYSVVDGAVDKDICYWGDMTFLPHLVNLMTKRQIRARVYFAPVAQPTSDRKQLARQLHAEVARLA
ncbi:MAG: lysophospholipid acyltransferase family protein [Verrucomicrobiota bacterium]